jgi:hypothetical protein
VDAYEFETAGHLDRDAEIYLYSTVSHIYSNGIPRSVGLLRTKQSILVKKTDIYEIGKIILDHSTFGEVPMEGVEPEIELIY